MVELFLIAEIRIHFFICDNLLRKVLARELQPRQLEVVEVAGIELDLPQNGVSRLLIVQEVRVVGWKPCDEVAHDLAETSAAAGNAMDSKRAAILPDRHLLEVLVDLIFSLEESAEEDGGCKDIGSKHSSLHHENDCTWADGLQQRARLFQQLHEMLLLCFLVRSFDHSSILVGDPVKRAGLNICVLKDLHGCLTAGSSTKWSWGRKRKKRVR